MNASHNGNARLAMQSRQTSVGQTFAMKRNQINNIMTDKSSNKDIKNSKV